MTDKIVVLSTCGSPEEAQKIAAKIGYPVIVKAAMGGGGRGMRVVHDATQLNALLEEAQGEARSAFGDASVFLEKYLPRAPGRSVSPGLSRCRSRCPQEKFPRWLRCRVHPR